ncbi:hypothetical protein [Rhodobacter capsulatus]|nr:hypothetical protein [Rhodobacter capsulatus]
MVLMGSCFEFEIEKTDHDRVRRKQVLIAKNFRDGAEPHDIVCLTTTTGRYIYAEVIGRKKASDDKLGLELTDRSNLGLSVGDRVELEVTRCGLFGKIVWYVTNNDPQLRISAILAVISFVLGMLGLLLGVISVYLSWRPT